MTDLTRHWFQGILRSIISGASTAGSVAFSQVVVTEHVSWRVIFMSMIIAGGLRLLEFLKRHPLPGITEDDIDANLLGKPKGDGS